MTLSEIALKYGTDKVRHPDGSGNDYITHYERLFAPIRHSATDVLEIGVQRGFSVQMWLEYFSNAQIYGVDIEHDTNAWNTPGSEKYLRYVSVTGDQADLKFWEQFVKQNYQKWDIIIDDGGHISDQIITTFDCMWPHVKSDGLYIIEDLKCSYSCLYQPVGSRSPMDMLKSKLDAMHTIGSDIESITFSRQLAILRKK
jgi:hypothetical protein